MSSFTVALDALAGALFLLTALGILATRQVLASLRLFVAQALLLAVSAVLLGRAAHSLHLFGVAAIAVVGKAWLIPLLLRQLVSAEVYRTREVERVLNIPATLLLAAALIVFAYTLAEPLVAAIRAPFVAINLPLGLATTLLGALTIAARREAVPQLFGLLAMENGVFFAAAAIAPNLSVLTELAAAIDVPVVAIVIGLLTRRIHSRLGTTEVGALASIAEP
jgi:hydrogenase-4 component E